jgi:glycosyltransferase involved in cell wall biosynthesis
MITFSVIIPNYNHAAYLRERIDSVLSQTYSNFELIILDDCSADNSRQIIESYERHHKISHIIFNEKNSGSPFLQWINGIELAKNEWIWIAESDDFADPNFLQEAAKAIQEHHSIGLFYCDGIIWESEKKSASRKFSDQKNEIFKTKKWDHSYAREGVKELNECLKFDNTVNNVSGVVFKKNLFRNATEKLRAFKYYGDWYLYIQLCAIAGIYYCDQPLNFYRKHSKSLLSAPTSSLVSRREYFMILRSLYYNDLVTDKSNLINHFCFHYLNIGLFSHPLNNSFKIIATYFRLDSRLALKIIPRLMTMKLFRKRYRRSILQIETQKRSA